MSSTAFIRAKIVKIASTIGHEPLWACPTHTSSASGARGSMRRPEWGTSCERFPCLAHTAAPIRRYDPLSSVPLQTLAPIALNPPPVAVYRSLLRRLAEPVPRAAIGLGNVGSQFQLVQTKHDFVAVIALVRHHFLDSVQVH